MAAILCFPSRWHLADKVGLPRGPIHAPLPCYKDRMEHTVDRLLTALKPGRCAQRLNWSVMDAATLFQPTSHGIEAGDGRITVSNAGERLVLRVER